MVSNFASEASALGAPVAFRRIVGGSTREWIRNERRQLRDRCPIRVRN
jgi:hypothetical protein